MLTTITDPSLYNLSRNPIPAQFETDSYIAAVGSLAVIAIDVGLANGANAIGGTFTFNWKENSVVLTIVASPDHSGYQVPAKGAMSDGAYGVALAAAMSKNYLLSENYFIIPHNITGSIAFFALRNGVDYNLHADFDTTNTGYELSATFLPGSDDTLVSNYKMKADLWMEDTLNSNVFTKRGTKERDPLNNKCIFDFQTEIDANLEYFLPAYGSTIPVITTGILKRFYLRFLERFGTPVLAQEVNQTVTGYALKAGIPTEDYTGTSDHIQNLFLDAGKFLTRQPRKKKVRSAQQEYLCWIAGVTGSVTLRATFKMKNYTADVIVDTGALSVNAYETWMFPTGYSAFTSYVTPAPAFDDILSYSIGLYLSPLDILVSEVFTYVPDSSSYIDEHYMFFSNAYGGIDTVRLTGRQEDAFSIEKQTIEKTRQFNSPLVNGQFGEVNHLKQNKMKVSTGFLSREQADWLEDLFMAECKLADINGQFVPIELNTDALKKYDSRSNVNAYDFEYSPAFRNKS